MIHELLRPTPGLPAQGLRALVVEDNAGDRWFYSELLRGRGYQVRSVESGEEALEAFRSEPVPLVLVDIMLPGMDGTELCRKLRANPGGAEPLILAVTGRDEPESLAEILAAGADDFVRKPVPPALFSIRMAIAERAIRDRVEGRGTRAQLDRRTWELERLFRNLPDVVFAVDLTAGSLLRISPSAEALFGRPLAALSRDGRLWRHLLLPAAEGDDPWAELARSEPGHRAVREHAVARPDGSGSWVRTSVTVDKDPATGHLWGYGVLVDITEEWGARRALSHRNEELAALYRVSELTLTSASPEVAYAEILREVARVMDAPVVLLEALDRPSDRLAVVAAHGVPLSDDATLEIPLHQTPTGAAVQSGRPLVDPDPRTRRDLTHGAVRALEPRFWASFPLTVSGAVAGALTVVDQTPRSVDERWTQLGARLAMSIASYMERMEAEEALRESEARHRTVAVQLRQANQELESFAYSVSHDLRAPLRTMQGFAHALLQNFSHDLPPGALDYVQRIIASGRQSERLIADLLAYSRLSFEQLEVKPVELDGVVKQALDQIHADVAEARAHVEVAPGLPMVLGNATALIQVIANLLSNAVKFVPPERRPEIRVRAEDRGEFTRLWVEDNGIGIPEGQQERIFRVFERLAEGGDHPGTGIGLAIVRRGMERIGGRCGVEPIPGGGSAFWIEAQQDRRKHRRPWSRRNRV